MGRAHRNKLLVGAVVVAAGVCALLATSNRAAESATAVGTLPRATGDRPDDLSGPQVHLFYVVPSDGTDRARDTDGSIATSVASWQAWLRGQTGGRGIRVDTYQGQPDITFFRLAADDAAIAAHGPFVREQIERELRAAGFAQQGKLYAVYYDGGSTFSCGGAPPKGTGDIVAAVYLQGTPPGAPPCATNRLGNSPPSYLEFAMLHEIVHAIGFVPPCAPHVTRVDHVSDSRFDLMWAGDQPWGTDRPGQMQLDVGHDDYYRANIPGCLDLSQSPYLDGGGASITVTISSRAGAGGSVTSDDGAVDCPDRCDAAYAPAPVPRIALRAVPDTGSAFGGWTGACAGASTTCVITLDTTRVVQAVFVAGRQRLRVAVNGPGRVTGAPAGINCPAKCGASYPNGTRVTLRAVAGRGARFTGWSGACNRARRCTVRLTSDRLVTAVFART